MNTCLTHQKFYFSGLKCKACKFRCHRDCEANVPPSCGLPEDYLNFYFNYLRKEGSPIMPRGPSAVPTIPGSGLHIPAYPDSSSNTSSCNSSTPSSPAVMVTSQPTPPHSAASVYSSKGSAFTFDVLPLTKVHQPCDNVSKNSSSPNPHIDSIRSNDSDKTLSGKSFLYLVGILTFIKITINIGNRRMTRDIISSKNIRKSNSKIQITNFEALKQSKWDVLLTKIYLITSKGLLLTKILLLKLIQ